MRTETTTDHENDQQPARTYNGRLAFYHPNSKGTGAAIQLELRINRPGENTYDCFFLEMAQQKTVGTRNANGRTPATFDWPNKATVKLTFPDICEILAVLENKKALAGGRGNGIYHEAGNTNTVIMFKKQLDNGGYYLGVSRKDTKGNQLFKAQMAMSESEAIGLRNILQTGLFYMFFHANIQPQAA